MDRFARKGCPLRPDPSRTDRCDTCCTPLNSCYFGVFRRKTLSNPAVYGPYCSPPYTVVRGVIPATLVCFGVNGEYRKLELIDCYMA